MVLTAQGAWKEAERELTEALRVGEAAEPAMRAEAFIRLAELRIAQGRVDEAAQLLVGLEDHPVAVPALAGTHLARGQVDAARTLLARRLSELPLRGPETARVAELLVDAETRSGRAGRALEVAESQWAEDLTGAVRHRAEATLGRALSAAGRTKDAVPHLERAVAGYGALDLPWELGRAYLSLARALGRDDPGSGTVDAEAALRIFERLGAARDADAAAGVLRDQGAIAPVRRGPRADARLTPRESEVLALLGEGLTNREVAERLFLTRKTVEHHVHRVLTKLDLRNRAEATAWVLRHGRDR
jgi:DNA-binding CsgD family transcriptional regulator